MGAICSQVAGSTAKSGNSADEGGACTHGDMQTLSNPHLIEGQRLHVNVVSLALGTGVCDGHCDGPLVGVLAAPALQTAADMGEPLAACMHNCEASLRRHVMFAQARREGRAHRKLPTEVHALDLKTLPTALGRPGNREGVAQGKRCHAPKRVAVLIQDAISTRALPK